MPPFTSKSKQKERDKRDRRRARSTPAHAPPLSTLPPAPPRHPRRGVTLTEVTRSGRKVIPSAKAIEENGSSAQTHTQLVQPTREFTDHVFEFIPWSVITDDEKVLGDDTDGNDLLANLFQLTPEVYKS